jgi:penicillin-binding protein 2
MKRTRRRYNREIHPEEIFIDSTNIPDFDTNQFEGRIEKPISSLAIGMVGLVFLLIVFIFISRLGILQIKNGAHYAALSANNSLKSTPIFAARGVIYDRNGVELAWNAPRTDTTASTSTDITASTTDESGEIIPLRKYTVLDGLSHTLGYVQYPSKDSAGFYYREDFEGIDGAEKYFNNALQGANGLKLIEVDAHNHTQSQNVIRPPKEGAGIYLSIDSRIENALYTSIRDLAERVGFAGGAGIIMDVHTGEVIAETSYPEFSSEIMSTRTNAPVIRSYLSNKNKPFLDRVTNGLYTPGSIIKPYMALAALNENIIDPNKVIIGLPYISIPNPYDSTKSTLFRDWKEQGPEDMRKAIQMSSDVYFYEIGGGYKDQKGLGINLIDKYASLFGFGKAITGGQTSGDSFFAGAAGTIPTPAWKAANFKGEAWYLGDTYHTAIGQYGYQVTPAQVVRAVASIANGGTLLNPTIIKDEQSSVESVVSSIPAKYFDVVREGMRLSAQSGVAKALNVPFVTIAAKSGTAELGVSRETVNSWITGFWPYENPKYAFAVMLEKGSVHNLVGAAAAMLETLNKVDQTAPEYFKQ